MKELDDVECKPRTVGFTVSNLKKILELVGVKSYDTIVQLFKPWVIDRPTLASALKWR